MPDRERQESPPLDKRAGGGYHSPAWGPPEARRTPGETPPRSEGLMSSIPETNDTRFEAEVLKSDGPVLVDFGAEWCHPCRQLEPIVEELAREWDGQVKVLRLDIDANLDTTMRFGVMGVPTLILFKGGEAVDRLTGFMPKQRILDRFAPHLDA